MVTRLLNQADELLKTKRDLERVLAQHSAQLEAARAEEAAIATTRLDMAAQRMRVDRAIDRYMDGLQERFETITRIDNALEDAAAVSQDEELLLWFAEALKDDDLVTTASSDSTNEELRRLNSHLIRTRNACLVQMQKEMDTLLATSPGGGGGGDTFFGRRLDAQQLVKSLKRLSGKQPQSTSPEKKRRLTKNNN